MPHKLLDCHPVDLGISQITRKGLAEVMPGDRLGEFALLDVPATFGALAFDIPDRSNAGGLPTGDKPPGSRADLFW